MEKINKLTHYYLNATDEDFKWGLHVRSVGKARVGSSAAEPEFYTGIHVMPEGRVINHYHISLILSGGVIFYDYPKDKKMKLKPGNVIISYPGLRHRYHADPELGREEIWVSFYGYYMDILLKKNFFPKEILSVSPNLNARLLRIFNSILDLASRQGLATQKQLSSQLLDLLSTLRISMLGLHNDTKSSSLVENAIEMMHSELGHNRDSAYFAGKLNISLPHFRRLFKHRSGIPPHLFFQKLKVDRSKEMLESDIPVKETASRLGFDDQCYFSRIFKKHTGISPGKYRDSLRQSCV